MFSLGEITPLSSTSPAVKKFKPWWEHIMEYLCYGLLALSLLGWARVTSIQATSLVCVLKDEKSMPDWTIRDATYANQRCLVEMPGWLLLFYPYVMLLQWLVFFTMQYLWLRLPTVYTRLETFHKLYSDMTRIPSKQHCQTSGDELDYDGEAKELMVVLKTKLLWLLHEGSVVYQAYRCKVLIMKIATFVTMSLLLYWIISMAQFETIFHCRLESSPVKVGYPDLLCNLTSGLLLYVLVISNLIMVTCMFILNVKAMSWLFSQRGYELPNFRRDHWELCKKFEGFEDFRFTLHLVFDDITEGHQIIKILRFCLADYMQQISQSKVSRTGESQTRL